MLVRLGPIFAGSFLQVIKSSRRDFLHGTRLDARSMMVFVGFFWLGVLGGRGLRDRIGFVEGNAC